MEVKSTKPGQHAHRYDNERGLCFVNSEGKHQKIEALEQFRSAKVLANNELHCSKLDSLIT